MLQNKKSTTIEIDLQFDDNLLLESFAKASPLFISLAMSLKVVSKISIFGYVFIVSYLVS